MGPRVAVLMPVHDARAYVREAVQSILAQSYRDFELILIDDGSTDGSFAVLERFARADGRIRLFRREARGLVPTLEEGLGLVRAPLVARMDADDVALPHRLEAQVEHLERDPACVCVGGAVEIIDEEDRPIGVVRPPVEHDAIDRCHLAGHTSIVHPTATMRTSVARRLGYRREHFLAEDLDLWLRLAEVGRLHNLPSPVLRYRRHARSLSASRREAQLRAIRGACASAYARRGVADTFTLERHWLPSDERPSRLRHAVDTGWTAFAHGHRRSAIAYGVRSVGIDPLSRDAWKLLVLASIKPLPDDGARTPRVD